MSSHAEQQGARINELNNGIVQQGVAEKYLQKAVVMLPSGNVQNFFVHKKSKGNVLTDLVSEHEGLLEKDYFGLNYVDNYGEKTWLYPNKRIAKQLKSVPWNFTLRVKFYAPEPSVLADDLTRYLLYLQIRKDVYDEVLPTSYPTKILLAGIVMQVEIGDFETSEQSAKEYDLFVRNARLVHSVDQEFLAKVREAHKEQKGLTTQEAHLKYLDAAKVLAKYGYTFFQGKDVKNANVTIGIHAHGITVYKDQVQIHKFWWQSIEKIQYSSNKFSILLKPGELDEKKQVTVRFSLPDYYTAKRLYRTAVEHHTFFRLIRPEDPPKNGLLSRVSSERFRYQGRTYFQAKMASQMFDNPTTTVQRTPSGRQVSRSVDDLAVQRSFSPLHYADESTHQATSPERSKSYSLTTKNKDKKLSKKSKKEEEKRRKKEDKEAAKRSKKNKKPSGDGTIKKPISGGGDADSVSSTSSSSESPTEHKKHHVAVGQAVAGPVEPLSTNQELVVLHGIPERHQITMAPQTAAVNHIDDNSSGPYTPAKNNDGRVLREETIEQVYRISGNGKVPKFDLTDMSLQAAVDNYVRETDRVPRIEMVEANILVRENEPLPQALREGSAPHTTVHTWYETEADPEQVTTEIDKYGNKITRTVKTQHTKHTIQKQSYQTYAVDGSFLPEQQTVIETTEETSPLGSDAVARSPVVHTKTRTVAYEKDSQNELTEPLGDFVSSKTITTGNRTVEILTYKTEKDGVVETRVEHRVTIHSGTDIDHDAELVTALLEATQMSPDLLINRVEVEKSAQS